MPHNSAPIANEQADGTEGLSPSEQSTPHARSASVQQQQQQQQQPAAARRSWRVVDIIVCAVIAVAMGVVQFAWNQVYNPITEPLKAVLPGSQALLYGVWLIPGVVAGLIVRKPGAALFASLVAASFSAILGSQWGVLTLEGGLVQGLGAELAFLLFAYRRWSLPVGLLAGALSGVAMGINDLVLWYVGYAPGFQVVYMVCATLSGFVIAGLGSWYLARALAATGALDRFAIGREARGRL